MKREEIIKKQAEDYADKHGFRVPYDGSNNFYDETDVKASLEGFIEGAKWADNNPSQQALAKELYRLGYTTTLNGDIIPRDEEEKAMKSYIEYQKSQVIEKACEWLKENIHKYREYDESGFYHEKSKFLFKDFKKAMEGGDE